MNKYKLKLRKYKSLKNVKWFMIQMYYFCLFFKYKSFLNKNGFVENYILIIDHSLGGGTELYTNNLINELVNKNKNILLIKNISSNKKNIALKINVITKKSQFELVSKVSEFKKILNAFIIEQIICNSLVSYHNYSYFLKEIENSIVTKNIPLLIMIHDFYPVCPNFTLISENSYCSLLCKEKRCNLKFFDVENVIDIAGWRHNWLKILELAIEIRCFSESSKQIFQQAYPSINSSKISVVPHSTSYYNFKPLLIAQPKKIKLGIVGSINTVAKGSLIVEKLIEYCFINDLQIEIVIIGQLNNSSKHKNLKVTGKYNCKNLPVLLLEHEINVVLFPSVWPETFSYLTSELMILGMPLVSFNLGAQAEKIKSYEKGSVCYSFDSEQIYLSILKLYNKNYSLKIGL